jgi:predicted dehydrogenase
MRMAQYGTGHGHASGKWAAMRKNPDVELVGIYEPDPSRRNRPQYGETRWYASADEMLGDATIEAVAVEGFNHESLGQALEVAAAGKHLWYDKPAGDDWPGFLALTAALRERKLYLQMGYMLRYHDAFQRVAEWTRGGELGAVFQVRAHFSTNIPVESAANSRRLISRHRGGMLYDLGGHMLDQVCWLLGRPQRVTSFLRNDATPELPHFADNTLGVFEFARAIATVDIAAMEPRPMARRFEVYGTKASAVLLEPFEPGGRIRFVRDGAGEELIETAAPSRQELYERELVAFLGVLGGAAPDRPPEHEVLVQETLLRATGGIPGG